MPSPKPQNIDEYISAFPSDVKKILNSIRKRIRRQVPQAGEKISYGIPCLTLDAKPLVYFAGYKQHVSIYPVPAGNAAFMKQVQLYRTGKGTMQFPIDKALPLTFIDKIVKFSLKRNATTSAAKSTNKKKKKT